MQMEVFQWGTITDYIDEDMDSPTVTANHIRLHTLRHMRSLLGERRWRELWGGVDLQPEQHSLRKAQNSQGARIGLRDGVAGPA